MAAPWRVTQCRVSCALSRADVVVPGDVDGMYACDHPTDLLNKRDGDFSPSGIIPDPLFNEPFPVRILANASWAETCFAEKLVSYPLAVKKNGFLSVGTEEFVEDMQRG